MPEFIIDDSTPDSKLDPAGFSTGYRGMFRSAASAAETTVAFPAANLIPRHEWQARAEEMKERKSRVSDICDAAGLSIANQAQTKFCWAFAPVRNLEVIRVIQNQPMVRLSPASVACKINGFKNNGGWGEDALQYLLEHGAVPSSQWPATAIDRKYDTPANETAAKSYRVTEWWRLEPRNHDQLVSCLLMRIPVAVGLNFWGHEVLATDPIWRNGGIDIGFDNSWSDTWGDRGRGILAGNKRFADDAVAARVAVAT